MNLEALMPKNTKTASEQPVSGSAPSSKVAAAIEEASSAVTRTRTKVASEGPIAAIEKLAEETARTLGRAKDAPYVAKLKTLSTGRLFDLFTVAQKRAKQQAAKAA